MKRIAGTCYIKVDGDQLEVSGGVSFPIVTATREAVLGSSGPVGYKETLTAPYIKVTAIGVTSLPLEKFRDAVGMTVTAETASGRTYTLSEAFVAGEPEFNGEDGTVELEFRGSKGILQ